MAYFCMDCNVDMIEDGSNRWECPVCEGRLEFEKGSDIPIIETVNWGMVSDPWDDEMPQECLACGDGAYPDCKIGCYIMDND